MKQKLDRFFKPKSIAVIGASNNTTKIGNAALKNILVSDYECDIYFPEIPGWFVPHWKSRTKVEKDTTYSYVIYKRRI